MQVGIDSFAAAFDENSRAVNPADRLRQLVQQIEHADEVGVDAFGIGEHHRREFLDLAPAVILGAAAARTQHIRLTSAVTVLSAEDPVRAFQNFATLDLLSRGRAEMIVGRGSSIEAFPLFGFRLEDYDALFAEKLDLLLNIREHEHVQWSGKFRPVDGAGRLSAADAESAADLARRRRHAGVVRTRGRARAPADGGDHRRRAAAIPAADRSLSGNRQAARIHRGELKVGVHMLGYVGDLTFQIDCSVSVGKPRCSSRFRAWKVTPPDRHSEVGWAPQKQDSVINAFHGVRVITSGVRFTRRSQASDRRRGCRRRPVRTRNSRSCAARA